MSIKSPRNAATLPNQAAGTGKALIRVKVVLGDVGQEPRFSPSLSEFQVGHAPMCVHGVTVWGMSWELYAPVPGKLG
jgi:hypothetical protein